MWANDKKSGRGRFTWPAVWRRSRPRHCHKNGDVYDGIITANSWERSYVMTMMFPAWLRIMNEPVRRLFQC